jgi:hypothetical protein
MAPFSFQPDENDIRDGKTGWTKDKTTLKSLLDAANTRNWADGAEIVVPTSRLRKMLVMPSVRDFFGPPDTSDAASSELVATVGTVETSDPPDESTAVDNTNNTDEVEFLQSVFDIGNDNTNDGMEENFHDGDNDSTNGEATFKARSCDKSDVFHIFQNLPLPKKKCPVRTLISRLLIHATFTFDNEDFEKVAAYLAKKCGIDTMEGLLEHFYFNREWWRRRVRMYPASCS